MGVRLRVSDHAARAEGAVEPPLGVEVEGEEAEPPGALHVRGHDHAAAEGAAPRRLVGPQHPLLLVAHEHQAHRSSPSASTVRRSHAADELDDKPREEAARRFEFALTTPRVPLVQPTGTHSEPLISRTKGYWIFF